MPKRVLIIDDDHDIAGALLIRLRALGYSAHHAPNGTRGLEEATQVPPDIILLDLRMPDMDGFEVNRRLKENVQLAQIPVICLSANLPEKVRKNAINSGIQACILKPYDTRVLMSAIENVVDT